MTSLLVDSIRWCVASGDLSHVTYDADDFPQHPELLTLRPDDDGLERRMLRLQDHGLSIASEPLDRGIAVDQRRHDVAAVRRLLPADHHEVSVQDVGADHAVALDPQREHLAALNAEPLGPEGKTVLAVLHSEDRRARGDAAEHGNLVATRALMARPPSGDDQRPRRALAGDPPLEHALALERLQMIEGRACREPEAIRDLPY